MSASKAWKGTDMMNRSSAAIMAEMDHALTNVFPRNSYGPRRQQPPRSKKLPEQEMIQSDLQTPKHNPVMVCSTPTEPIVGDHALRQVNSSPKKQSKARSMDSAAASNVFSENEINTWDSPCDVAVASCDSPPGAPMKSAHGLNHPLSSCEGTNEGNAQVHKAEQRRSETHRIRPFEQDHRGAIARFDAPQYGQSTTSLSPTGSASARTQSLTSSLQRHAPAMRSSPSNNADHTSPPSLVTSHKGSRTHIPHVHQHANHKKAMTCDDVIAYHQHRGDYERQRRQYGAIYQEQLLLENATPAQKAAYARVEGTVYDTRAILASRNELQNQPVEESCLTKTETESITPTKVRYPEAAGRTAYPVPELGSEAMPLLELHSFGRWEKFSKQIAKHLDEDHLRDVPPPVYAFSSRKNKPTLDPAITGAAPAPPRGLEPPLPNIMDPAHNATARFQRFRQGQGRTPTEFEDEDLPPANSNIVHETAPVASRWAWFINPALSAHGDDIDNLQARVVDQQLSAQYDHRVDADCWKYDDHGSLRGDCDEDNLVHVKLRYIDNWMIYQFVNTVAQPYRWDMSTEGFRSGDLPCSGLAYDYQEFPSDIGYEPTAYYYGPLDWDAIPSPKLNQPEYLENRCFNQTSQAVMDQEIAKLTEQSRDHFEAMKVMKRIRTQREINKQAQVDSIATMDTSQAALGLSPYSVQGKIYIRPFSGKSDLKTMLHIYNYYVCNTIDAPEINKVNYPQFANVIQRASTDNYPCLVAVLRIDPGDPPVAQGLAGYHGDGTNSLAEHVVGFTICSPWSTTDEHAFVDIATLQVFVSPQYIGRKIATNLLDRAIGCIDNDYQSKQGAEIRVPNTGPPWNRGWREPQTICMRWFFDNMNTPHSKGRRTFLEEHFGFVETGQLINTLSKDRNRTRYSMIIMQREANRLPKIESAYDATASSGFW